MTLERLGALAPLLLALSSPVLAQDDRQALDILHQAGQALEQAGSVSYDYVFEGADPLPGKPNRFSGHFTGSVRLRPAHAQHGMIYHATISGRQTADAPQMKLTLATDGVRACVLDHLASKMTCGDVARGARSLLGWGAYVVLPELAIPSMFQQTLAFDEFHDLAPVTVGNTVSDGVRAIQHLPSGMREVRWYFGAADHLPRRQVWIDRMQGLEGEMRFEISSLRTRLDLPDSAFQLAAPDGYRFEEDPGPFLAVGKPAPEFRVVAEDGTAWSLARLRGQPVLLYFWMPACGFCKAIEPELMELLAKLRQQSSDARVLGINIFPMPDAELEPFLPPPEAGMSLVREPGSIARDYRVAATPTLTLIDARGAIRFHSVGAGKADLQAIEQLLLDHR